MLPSSRVAFSSRLVIALSGVEGESVQDWRYRQLQLSSRPSLLSCSALPENLQLPLKLLLKGVQKLEELE